MYMQKASELETTQGTLRTSEQRVATLERTAREQRKRKAPLHISGGYKYRGEVCIPEEAADSDRAIIQAMIAAVRFLSISLIQSHAYLHFIIRLYQRYRRTWLWIYVLYGAVRLGTQSIRYIFSLRTKYISFPTKNVQITVEKTEETRELRFPYLFIYLYVCNKNIKFAVEIWLQSCIPTVRSEINIVI